jgi:hypothetical protein
MLRARRPRRMAVAFTLPRRTGSGFASLVRRSKERVTRRGYVSRASVFDLATPVEQRPYIASTSVTHIPVLTPQEFTPRRARANQRADVGGYLRPPRAMSTFPGPEQAKDAAMSGEHRLWLHDVERPAPAVPSLRQPLPQHTRISRCSVARERTKDRRSAVRQRRRTR